MKLKQQLLYLVTGGCVAVGAIVSAYSGLVLKNTLLERELASQKQSVQLLSEVLNQSGLKEETRENSPEKLTAFYNGLRREAYDSLADLKKLQINSVDFLGLGYFAKGSDSSMVMTSMTVFPKGGDCQALYKIPPKMQENLQNEVQQSFGDFSRFVCYSFENQNFLGYLLPLNLDDKAWLYLKKVNALPVADPKAPAFTPETFVKDLNLNPTALCSGYASCYISDTRGKILFASKDPEDAALADGALVSDVKTGKFTAREHHGGQDRLVTAAFNEQTGLLVSAESPRSSVIMPAVIAAFVSGILTILLVILLIYQIQKGFKSEESRVSAAIDGVKRLAGDDLRDPEKLASLTENLITNESHSFTDLHNAVGHLGKSLGEHLASSLDETAKQNYVEAKQKTLCNVHQKLLPMAENLPSSRFVDIASSLLPASVCGGDFYDIFRVDRDNIAFVVGQASEKGAVAVKGMAEILVLMRRLIADETMTPGRAMNAVNRNICSRNPDKVTFSVFAMILSEFTGNFICADAGFPVPLLTHLHKAHELTIGQGVEVGRDEATVYTDFKDKLDFGDCLCFVSDGVHNAKNAEGESYGRKRVISALEPNCSTTAADLLIALLRDLKTFTKDVTAMSDMTAVTIRKNDSAKNVV